MSFRSKILEPIQQAQIELDSRTARQRLVEMRISCVFIFLMLCSVFAAILYTDSHKHKEAMEKAAEAAEAAPFTFSTADSKRFEVQALHFADGVPAVLYIDGDRWDVSLVNHFQDDNGYLDGKTAQLPGAMTTAMTICKYHEIVYIAAHNRTVLRENIWHEIYHAAACNHGGATHWNSHSDGDGDHEGIDYLGDFMAQFAMANPQFMAWAASSEP